MDSDLVKPSCVDQAELGLLGSADCEVGLTYMLNIRSPLRSEFLKYQIKNNLHSVFRLRPIYSKSS